MLKAAVLKEDRIGGRLVEIELGEAKGRGWAAVGVVKQGLDFERGMVFEVEASDPVEAEERLLAEIEAYFA
jgi:predicted N-acetyltransferase YhbS